MFEIEFPQWKKKVKGTETILELARRGGIFIPSPCNGKGICKKCKIRVEGNVKLTGHLNNESRVILACQAIPLSNLKVWVEVEETVLQETEFKYTPLIDRRQPPFVKGKNHLLAVDTGTSTVFMCLLNREGKIIKSMVFTNPQKQFGDDVITRVNFGKTVNGVKLLKKVLIEMLRKSLTKMPFRPECGVFVGNSVMLHILTEKSLRPFIKAPYKINYKGNSITKILGIPIYIPPLKSAFLGADFLSGLALVLQEERQPFLYIDLGTNTEISLFTGKEIFATSTPAGSALEGGHITAGMPPVEGAIERVKFERGFVFESKGKAKGICGSGLIDLVSVFLSAGIIEKSGKLNLNKARFYGFSVSEKNKVIYIQQDIPFSQEDVRKFQLTKSAIRTGCEILCMESGLPVKRIKKCYIAGSFGESININSFKKCGFIPPDFNGKFIKGGNMALKGAIQLLYSADFVKNVQKLTDKLKTVQLPEHPQFEKIFLEKMSFE